MQKLTITVAAIAQAKKSSFPHLIKLIAYLRVASEVVLVWPSGSVAAPASVGAGIDVRDSLAAISSRTGLVNCESGKDLLASD